MESNSYNDSVIEECHKKDNLKTSLDKLKREQIDLQCTFRTSLEKFNSLQDKYSKLIQITEFQYKNLDQITTVSNLLLLNLFVIN